MTPDLFNPAGRFQPPQESECCAYAAELGMDRDQGSAFHDYQTSKGWFVGKSKMKDWRAALRTWKRNAARSNPKLATSLNQTAADRIRKANVG